MGRVLFERTKSLGGRSLFLQDAYRLKLADGSAVEPAGADGACDDDEKCQQEPQRVGRKVRLRDAEGRKSDAHHLVV